MIITCKRHGGFLQVAKYHAQKVQKGVAKLLYSNLVHRDSALSMAKEFSSIASLNPRVKRTLNHVMISLPEGIRLNDQQLRLTAHQYMVRMGYRYSQSAVWLHTDTKNQHIHLLLNQVRYDGTVVCDDNIKVKQENLARHLETMFNLPATPSSLERRRKITKKEISSGQLTRASAISLKVQSILETMPYGGSFRYFAEQLALQGVTAALYDRDETHAYPRLFYWHQGVMLEAIKVDPASTIDGLRCRHINFDDVLSPGEPCRRLHRVREPKNAAPKRKWRMQP